MYKFFRIDETADNPIRLMKFIRQIDNMVVIVKPDCYEFAYEDSETHELRYVRERFQPVRARHGDVLYIDDGKLYRFDMKMVGIVDAWRKWRNES